MCVPSRLQPEEWLMSVPESKTAVVVLAGDRLQVTTPQRVTFAIFHESETKFFARDRDLRFEVIVDQAPG